MNQRISPKAIRRSDYTPPSFWLQDVTLKFELYEEHTRVSSRLNLVKNSKIADAFISLDGEDLKLISVAVDGRILQVDEYEINDERLKILNQTEDCIVEIETEIYPHKNTRLEGLYRSSKMYCTQCEAQGFRRITYFPDRPDVMAKYSVEISADSTAFPVLLSNGNLVEKAELENGRHWAKWEDPFPKPSYLFALVAGQLTRIEDSFATASGREVDLHIFVEDHNANKCAFAMASLINSMKWDEQRFGLEYDLDVYMIVAVDDFNMGAMENKGLNVFNSKFVLADKKSATDSDFAGIESVIGHEYFHNWSGNRVTCRDWFQLSLKEGLTVFRDQEFSSDLNARAVNRIENVRALRARQFPEDAGPMAHPIRPDSYIEINNFYTATVYEKGAEVIRMIHTLLGEIRFRRGMDLYFKRHDGQAVTCEDFVLAMEAASGVDLSQFRRWYSQTGTPTITVETQFDEKNSRYSISTYQTCKTQKSNKPFHIPFTVGLLDSQGQITPILFEDSTNSVNEIVLNITDEHQTFHFQGVKDKPVVSMLRGFSAPVILEYNYSDKELAYLMRYDPDSFNRWESGQRLATRTIVREINSQRSDYNDIESAEFVSALSRLLDCSIDDAAIRAETLTLPSIDAIAELQERINIESIHKAKELVRKAVAIRYEKELTNLYGLCIEQQSDELNSQAMGIRRLKNICLNYLSSLDSIIWKPLVLNQYHTAQGMTDSLAALNEICQSDLEERQGVLDDFYSKWKDDRLVIDKWFTIQAVSRRKHTLDEVNALTAHVDFEISNPNRIRSLVGAFSMANPLRFHADDGRGYEFLTNYIIELNSKNPQLAARLTTPLTRWRRYDETHKRLMQVQLKRISQTRDLSADVYEIVSKSLE